MTGRDRRKAEPQHVTMSSTWEEAVVLKLEQRYKLLRFGDGTEEVLRRIIGRDAARHDHAGAAGGRDAVAHRLSEDGVEVDIAAAAEWEAV